MKNLPLIFCGVFATIAFSWGGLILTSQIQYGHLKPIEVGDISIPSRSPQGGPASAGKDEYIKLGCIYCHTQQVRPAELFRKGDEEKIERGDIARGWAPRHTVARDYITQERVVLGTMRTGPDLANVGARLAPDWHYRHFLDPQLTSPGSNMPPFAFLFEKVDVTDGRPVPAKAIQLSAKERAERGIGENIHFVPTKRLENLVAYLMSLKIEGSLPEAEIKE